METQFAAVLGAVVIAGFVAAIVLWTGVIRSYFGSEIAFSESILPVEPRQVPFWRVFDFLFAFGLSLVLTILIQGIFISQGWIERFEPDESIPLQTLVASLVGQSLSGLLVVGVTLAWLRLIRPDAVKQLGFDWKASDMQLGFRASAMLIPPTLLISSAVSYLVPYHHPVMESLEKSPSIGIFAILFVGTAIIAPLVEEFLFRVLMQGSLQQLADSIANNDDTVIDREETPSPHWTPRSYWPIVVTSVIFALMHFGQGAAPIPLFVLSLGLGFLYRQTGRITPSLVVHCVLNGFSLSAEFARLWVEKAS
ncbi:CAAX amino terminal protease self- immunity [Planctomycetes bacterium CA13]|uniref:CAAX amino terminal protease self-immunity n=1 Tax=Novipirellula herctigrandis TaxID=2527986 RepID=A0A5C5Z7T6_9BACT|nr:CAAX amino terminal protease self- immunity [Planctomycetes bacterium CA13]